MNDLKEQAKKVIAKGKALNDPELVRMGLEMLDAYGEDVMQEQEIVMPIVPSVPSIETKKTTTPIATAGKFDMNQFAMSKSKSNVIDKSGKKQPIYIGPRDNKYSDDGLEAKDVKTPDTPRVERARKPAEATKVEMTCQVCGKKEKVLRDYIYTEYYRCESCLLKGKV